MKSESISTFVGTVALDKCKEKQQRLTENVAKLQPTEINQNPEKN